MIVIDSSALVHAYTDPGKTGEEVRRRVARASLVLAPHLLDVEIASALLGMARGVRGGEPKLTREGLEAALAAYTALPLRRCAHLPLLPRMRMLSHNLSVYDATYVALAEAYGAPLVTSDRRIERSGVACCTIDTIIAAEASEGTA